GGCEALPAAGHGHRDKADHRTHPGAAWIRAVQASDARRHQHYHQNPDPHLEVRKQTGAHDDEHRQVDRERTPQRARTPAPPATTKPASATRRSEGGGGVAFALRRGMNQNNEATRNATASAPAGSRPEAPAVATPAVPLLPRSGRVMSRLARTAMVMKTKSWK